MTKSAQAASVGALAFLLIALVPAASAHGALELREIDTRVLVDQDGALGPASCAHEAPQTCDARPKGLDLVSLDMRETHWVEASGPVPVGTPVVVFRLTVQENIGAAEQVVEIHATAGGAEQHFGFASNGTSGNYTSDTCLALVGPEEAGGDGAQRVFECYVTHAALGANATAAAITAIEVHSEVAEAAFDVMPGTWYVNDQLVAFVPAPNPDDPTHVPEAATEPGAYNLTGPAALLNATASVTSVDLRDGAKTVAVSLSSVLSNMSQDVRLNVTMPAGIQASLDPVTVILDGDANATATLSVASATRDGAILVVVTSDLGAYQVFAVAVQAPPAAPVCPTASPASGNATGTTGATTGCPTTSSSTESSGAPEMVFVLGLLAVLAATRRRVR